MTARQERALAPMGPQALAPAQETDWREVERIFRGMIARDTNPAAVDAAIMVCQQLGFNPILQHIFLIKGQVYVSHKGLLNLAHRNPTFDGIELLEEAETQTHWTAKVAVHRKDMGYPFVYTGRYPKAGDKKQYGPEMAVTRAETAALRRAFDVSMPIYEEINWQEQPSQGAGVTVREAAPPQITPPAKPAPPPPPAVGLDDEQFGDFLTGFETLAAEGHSGSALRDAMRAKAAALDLDQRKVVSDLYLAIIQARKAGESWPHPDTEQPAAPIEATVVETPPIEVGPLGESLKPATARQVSFIFAVGKAAGLDELTVNAWSQELYGRDVDQLNRRDATLLIEALQRRRNEGYQRPQSAIDADKALEEIPFD